MGDLLRSIVRYVVGEEPTFVSIAIPVSIAHLVVIVVFGSALDSEEEKAEETKYSTIQVQEQE